MWVVGGQFVLIGVLVYCVVVWQVVCELLVLLKNQNGFLLLLLKQWIFVVGDGVDDVGKQVGGWMFNWQGIGIICKDFFNVDMIYEGIVCQVRVVGGEVVFVVDGCYVVKFDVVVVVFGEDFYVEFQGDWLMLVYEFGNEMDLVLFKWFKVEGILVVVVFLSGWLFWVNWEINVVDVFVVVWLLGLEGVGIVDVFLCGSDGCVQYDFKGKFSYSWLCIVIQYVNNVGQKDYDLLFVFGFGLIYVDNGDLVVLLEVLGVIGNEGVMGVFFVCGDVGFGMVLCFEQVVGQGLIVICVLDVLFGDWLKIIGVDYLVQEDG